MKEPRRAALPGSSKSAFKLKGLVSRLLVANLSDSGPSWWCVHGSAKVNSSKKDSGRLVEYMKSPFCF